MGAIRRRHAIDGTRRCRLVLAQPCPERIADDLARRCLLPRRIPPAHRRHNPPGSRPPGPSSDPRHTHHHDRRVRGGPRVRGAALSGELHRIRAGLGRAGRLSARGRSPAGGAGSVRSHRQPSLARTPTTRGRFGGPVLRRCLVPVAQPDQPRLRSQHVADRRRLADVHVHLGGSRHASGGPNGAV